MITYLKGDATVPVITKGVRILPHICNDLGGWGSGYVVALSKRWLEPEKNYREWFKSGYLKLGEAQFISVKLSAEELDFPFQVNPRSPIIVANMIAQHGYRSKNNPIPLQYDALSQTLELVDNFINKLKSDLVTIHIPRIGCGLAGGKWELVEELLQQKLNNDIYVYDLG